MDPSAIVGIAENSGENVKTINHELGKQASQSGDHANWKDVKQILWKAWRARKSVD